MMKHTLIAATLTAIFAASSAAANDELGAGGAPASPGYSEPQDRAPPMPERRRHRERRRYHGADYLPGYGPPGRAIDDAYSLGEWNYGQPPQEAPAPSPRGLHNGLWYY
ncbi:hypothetical protein [Methylosinus sp. Sm6]|uniref:hypothetical protein n=1 Tax=Methylosinus sp. Sm6 TaxID=2866948 RepID=UPI001C991146|nr:hypothetical protein [Methylosinus sp. Sm6]MBY6240196.1 hypothetical protein [Methylosinus sp. Sm6]